MIAASANSGAQRGRNAPRHSGPAATRSESLPCAVLGFVSVWTVNQLLYSVCLCNRSVCVCATGLSVSVQTHVNQVLQPPIRLTT
jgi:hypothetical protein